MHYKYMHYILQPGLQYYLVKKISTLLDFIFLWEAFKVDKYKVDDRDTHYKYMH